MNTRGSVVVNPPSLMDLMDMMDSSFRSDHMTTSPTGTREPNSTNYNEDLSFRGLQSSDSRELKDIVIPYMSNKRSSVENNYLTIPEFSVALFHTPSLRAKHLMLFTI